ncbi:Crp/Fnr family transcriptional regulator [Bradyrhizobium sp. AUGA SZCCT0240]|jgi:CRP-like cAMP-binding protein|uniref:Crp/Fnr family transcriptional regulator n=1 Tax=unclassified Bradyrhizobium TaxID=2631580 RepID=UPI001BAD21CF|nr:MULTISPECIES: Crp/Fnr family transcriptional regulator [unclassified Bradyrhizobium]MBR1192754.1 Crp/Fnr family transcriptional regulator [Bradyrhizobium sp. AUGA SZCCT0160]MBR1243696.1 Crp/Fnr family transcriptional regulator [Bradyrhizobium sp. AUGA SZCCT0274]MBR1246061.1 Crp/Fnr family transcriptional regulator [Bradyrhizobium sp. AUGA SZCCT0169]MBR1254921.1 Crp/Fnr family transcriptional regulator [Bradyrhizobium sp. AUGA SZCCT0240]
MSSKDTLVSLLSKTELFKGLALEDLEACIPSFREAKFKKGQALFTRGERATGLYLVAEGRVRLAIATEDGRELSFRHATAGELLGEIAALDGGTRSADATALTAVTTYRLDKEDFRKLWTARPVLSERLISFLCSRLRDTSGQLESIALHPMHVRLARFFLVAIGDRKPVPGKRLPLDLGMSQGELALLLGASRPKINEALGKLEEVGAIGRTLDRIFCDPLKLAEVDGSHA